MIKACQSGYHCGGAKGSNHLPTLPAPSKYIVVPLGMTFSMSHKLGHIVTPKTVIAKTKRDSHPHICYCETANCVISIANLRLCVGAPLLS